MQLLQKSITIKLRLQLQTRSLLQQRLQTIRVIIGIDAPTMPSQTKSKKSWFWIRTQEKDW